jgi:kynurenine formamidase
MFVDLTMSVHEGMASHPFHGRTPLFLSGTLKHDRLYPSTDRRNPYDGSQLSFENANFQMCDHTGTHMDAPVHADPEGIGVDEMAIDYGHGDAVWLDLSAHFDDAAEITAEHLEAAERAGGETVRDGDILLLWTGWSTVLPDVQRYLYAHMGLTRDAAEWVRAKGVRTMGIDTCTPETVSGAKTSPVHMNLLRPRSLGGDDPVIAIVENLVNINQIPVRRFTFSGVPLPLKGLTGSPVRAFAQVPTR